MSDEEAVNQSFGDLDQYVRHLAASDLLRLSFHIRVKALVAESFKKHRSLTRETHGVVIDWRDNIRFGAGITFNVAQIRWVTQPRVA